MAEPKAPPPPEPIKAGTVFIKNPTGGIHDVSEDDPRNALVLEEAKKSHNGWSLASEEEIAAYCELHNIIPPGGKVKKAAEATEVGSQEPETLQTPAEPVKKGRRQRRAKVAKE